MANRRIKRYSRRRSNGTRRVNAAPILLSILAFLILSIAISVVIGIQLGKKAESNEEEKYDLGAVEYTSGGKTVRAVEAYDLTEGHSVVDYIYQGITDLSICIRHSDGSIPFDSAVGREFAFDEITSSRSLEKIVGSAHNNGGSVWTYFYVTSLSFEDANIREVYKAYELALIAEAAEAGVDGILLLGLDVGEENIDEAEDYAKRASIAAGDAVLGVTLSAETMLLTENEIYVAGRMKNACDHLALDLTHIVYGEETVNSRGETVSRLSAMIERMEYYIKAYSMRLVFSKENSKLHTEAQELGANNLQIVDK